MKKKQSGYSESELPMLLQSMASLSLVVVVCVGGFFCIGYLLDKYLGTGVTGIVISTFSGAIIAIYWAYKKVSITLNKIFKEEISADSDEFSEEVGQGEKKGEGEDSHEI